MEATILVSARYGRKMKISSRIFPLPLRYMDPRHPTNDRFLFFFGVDHGEETDGIILGVIISLCYVEISLYFKFPRQITKT